MIFTMSAISQAEASKPLQKRCKNAKNARQQAITDVSEAKKLLASGWEYKTSYPATIANMPHYVLVKRE
jgi:hypothetical protein